ncbi:MAG TPA: carboxypeptidase regulatory-like domain-containing protein, partial [Terriglobales bacterium]|nr:carboxypeptidase regulatory-like domain-containing protein [Terriglobales bacterium]
QSFVLSSWILVVVLTAAAQQPARNPRGEFEVSGRLVNALTGEAVHNAFVQLSPVAQPGQTARSEVSTDGSFAFHNLLPGKYALMAQGRGFTPQMFEQHENFSTAIVVGADKISTDLVFRLHPQSSISGRVLDEHNEPVREAHVMLFYRNNDLGRRTIETRGQMQTDDRGEYHFDALGPGTYYLALSAQPWYRRYLQQVPRHGGGPQPQAEVDSALDVAYPLTYYPSTTDADSASAILLRPGDRISADFNLTPVPSLHLTFRNSNPDGTRPDQPNFQQVAFGEPVGFFQPSVISGQNEIEVSGIAPGDYALNVFHADGKQTSTRTRNLTLQQSGELDPSSGESLEHIHGVVKFEGDRPPADTFLQLRDLSSGRSLGARLDDQGEFTIQPEHAGRYVIALFNAQGYAIRSISATGGRVSGRTVEFTGSQPLELTIGAAQGVGTVNGMVMNGDKGRSGAMVVLVPQDVADNASLFRRDQSDSDGTFTLHDVVPGRYTAIAIQNG